MAKSKYKTAIQEAINGISANGSFASWFEIAEQLPSITVQDVGEIKYPLSQDQAQKIIDKAHQAPFGKGSKTLVDTSVRKTWELDPELFNIDSPEWTAAVQKMLDPIRERLGINENIRAVPYKMLVYEPGAFFKEHKDTNNKIPSMFGTMVLVLPSQHAGGHVRLRHADKEIIYPSDQSVASVACWYSDVDHEVLEVKVGHRWVVSFNLAVDQDVPIPIAQDRLDRKLQAALVGWVQEIAGRESHLVCPLEHKYTEANLDLKSMKGDDRARLDNLVGLSPQLNLDIFFATIEKMQMGTPYWSGYGGHYGGGYGKRSGWYDEYDEEDEEEEDQEEKHSGEFHDIEEVVDTQYEMKLVKDIGGRQVASSLVLDTDCLAEGEGAFLEDTPDEEDYEEYMGNSGPTATHYYRLSAVVIVPKAKTAAFLTNGWSWRTATENAQVVEYFAQKVQSGADGAACEEYDALQSIWATACDRQRKDRYPSALRMYVTPESCATILLAALDRNDHVFFKRVCSDFSETLPLQFFRQLGDRLRANGNDILDPVLTETGNLIQRYESFYERYAAVEALRPRDLPSVKVFEFAKTVLNKFAGLDPNVLTEADGRAVASYAALYLRDVEVVRQLIVPWLKGSIADPIGLAFFQQWWVSSCTKLEGIPEEDGIALYRELARLFVDAFCPKSMKARHPAKQARTYYGATAGAESSPHTTPNSLANLTASLVLNLVAIGAGPELDKFADVIHDGIGQAEGPDLAMLWLPFLQDLSSKLQAIGGDELANPRYQRVFAPIIRHTKKKYVGPRPEREGLARKPVPCGCADCSALNAFLRDPARQGGRFAVNQRRRTHLHRKLDEAGVDCTHVTQEVGSPYTLVVTKTHRQHGGRCKAWEDRCGWMAGALGEMAGTLAVVVRDDVGDVMALPGGGALPARQRGNLRAVSGTKRKAVEIIDLTGEY